MRAAEARPLTMRTRREGVTRRVNTEEERECGMRLESAGRGASGP